MEAGRLAGCQLKFCKQILPRALVEVSRRNKDVLLEADKFGGIVTGARQRAIGENALRADRLCPATSRRLHLPGA